jgi:hypothetical protein
MKQDPCAQAQCQKGTCVTDWTKAPYWKCNCELGYTGTRCDRWETALRGLDPDVRQAMINSMRAQLDLRRV